MFIYFLSQFFSGQLIWFLQSKRFLNNFFMDFGSFRHIRIMLMKISGFSGTVISFTYTRVSEILGVVMSSDFLLQCVVLMLIWPVWVILVGVFVVFMDVGLC